MTQTRLHFTAPKARAEAIFQALELEFEDDGNPLAIIEVDEKQALFEVSLYTDDASTDEQRIRASFGPGDDFCVNCEELPDIDWVAKSLEGLKPVRAGRFIVHGAHGRDSRRPGQIGIEIEAGRAFGTGHHGTTAGCLMMIEEVVRRARPATALDLGTGSAVLAIGLAKLARIPVLATDIDPVAVAVARQNVQLNGMGRRVNLITAPGFHHAVFSKRRFDMIIANILARPLMKLAPAMARHLKPGGSLILSGILDHQRRAVLAAYANVRFRHIRTRQLGEWVTLHLKRG